MLNRCNNGFDYDALSGTLINQSINERLSQHRCNNNNSSDKKQTTKLNRSSSSSNTATLTALATNMDNKHLINNNIYNFIRSQQSSSMYSSTPPIKFMLTIQIVLLICLSTIINLTQAQTSDLMSVLKKNKITPDLLPNPPQVVVNLKINDKTIAPGETISIKDLKNPPSFSWAESNVEAMSTIIILDVDRHKVSSNKSIDSYNHYTTINIPGDQHNSGLAVVAYDPPGKLPSPNCHSKPNPHRFLVLVYYQNEVVDIQKVVQYFVPSGYSPKREDFKPNNFASSLGLTLKAVNVFRMQLSESDGLCSGTDSIYQISKLSLMSTIVSTLFMLLMSHFIKDTLQ